jgi:hypothetical protein
MGLFSKSSKAVATTAMGLGTLASGVLGSGVKMLVQQKVSADKASNRPTQVRQQQTSGQKK